MTLKNGLFFLFLWAVAGCDSQSEINYKNLKMFPQGKAFDGFQLTDHNGKLLDSSFFKDHITVVFFGFTNCPDICPMTLTELKKTAKMLNQNNQPQPQVLFISVDPDRDQTDQLKNYIEYFNPAFTAATGDAANILSLASQLGVAYHVEDHETNQLVYDVDHSSALFLINRHAERVGIFPAPHTAKTLAEDLTLYMESL